MEQRLENLLERINDLNKNVDGCQHELESLVQMTDVINTKQLEDIFNAVEANTKDLVVASAANKRASASLQVMQIILAASMAFDLVDRFTGLDLNLEPLSDWQQWIIDNLITSAPGVWFAFNMVWCAAVCFMLIKLMKHLQGSARGSCLGGHKWHKKRGRRGAKNQQQRRHPLPPLPPSRALNAVSPSLGFLTLTSRRNDLINIKVGQLIDSLSAPKRSGLVQPGR